MYWVPYVVFGISSGGFDVLLVELVAKVSFGFLLAGRGICSISELSVFTYLFAELSLALIMAILC